MKRIVFGVIAAVTLSVIVTAPSTAALKAGSTCKKAGLTTVDSGRKYTCVKQGKKFVWDKGVVVKAAPAKVPAPLPTPTPSAAPTPSQSSTPEPPKPSSSPTFVEPVRAKSFDDVLQNSEGLTYWAWKLAQERKSNSGKVQVEFIIDVGPNTQLNFPNPRQVLQETADFYSKFEQVKKFHAVFFNYADLNWAIELDKKYSSNPRPDEVRRSCSSEELCNGGNAYVDGNLNGFTYIASSPKFASEIIRKNGVLESHEYFHTIQVLPLMAAQATGKQTAWMPDWIREGSAEWLSTAMYFSDYSSLMMYQISRSEADLYSKRYSPTDISKILSTNTGISDNGWLAYNVGGKAVEILVVLKGVDSILELYVEGSKGVPFEQAFEKIYGISWEKAKPILSAVISKKYRI